MPGNGAVGASYGDLLVTSLIVLGGVCVAAFVVVRLVGRFLATGRTRGAHLLDIVARLSLEPRRSLYVVEVAGKTLLVGTSEMGLSVLSELDAGEVRARVAERPSFGELVRKAWLRRRGPVVAELREPDSQYQAGRPARVLDAQDQAGRPVRVLDAQDQAAQPARARDVQDQAAPPGRVLDAQDQAGPGRALDAQDLAARPRRAPDARDEAARPRRDPDARDEAALPPKALHAQDPARRDPPEPMRAGRQVASEAALDDGSEADEVR